MIRKNPQVSIILPTYNESKNVLDVLKTIRENLPWNTRTETIVVDDNSPDGTGRIADEYIRSVRRITDHTMDVVHRRIKGGLSSAILSGIQHASGDIIIVMDSDLSHPPQIIPRMVDLIRRSKFDIVIASRYVPGGKIRNWSMKRKLQSKVAVKIAQRWLGVRARDPMSGFFAFRKGLISDLKLDAIGYKILLEILVKSKGASVKEIPYTFSDRRFGSSKLGYGTILDYLRSVWRLYRHGRRRGPARASVRFLSKAARFYTVGASGLGVNYLLSLLLVDSLWYLHANILGILGSMTSNFILNKFWTFEDRDFAPRKTLAQYAKFVGVSSLGALVQLGAVFLIVEGQLASYPIALIPAVAAASFGNFVLNKRYTFGERVWS